MSQARTKTFLVVVSGLLLIGVILFSFLTNSKTRAAQNEPQQDFGGEIKFPDNVCLTEDKRSEIQAELQSSINRLRSEGKIAPIDPALPPMFIFPVRGNGAAAGDFGVHAISNFVDHNPNFPSQLADYSCGTRTYDTATGYNHKGVDIFTFPFWWNKMDNNEVVAIAAADGIIISKTDGNFDRSCTSSNNNWNAVYVRHPDGTVSWYGHLKRSSLTAKAVGATVAQGEYLGVVGSSGNSTGPHLHFEIYNAANQLQDPYQGACNLMNTSTYWLAQPAYRDSRINKLMTHSAPPVVFSTCPNPETPNEKKVFLPGEQLFVAAYYRDQVAGQQSQHSIIQPNGTVFASWLHTSPSTYNSSYWYWIYTLPGDAQRGAWKHRVVYEGQTYENTFFVGRNTAFDFDGDNKSDIGVFRPEQGAWYLQRSTAGFTAANFGIATDKLTPADYDGDGRTDIAVFRDGNWYLQRSALGFTGLQFGAFGDIPVPADYDGDGKADIAVFRGGNWYIQQSSNNVFRAEQFGISTDKPVPADYDGDGKTDVAVYRDGNWYLLRSQLGFTAVSFGIATDRPVPADYDGDGRADPSVYRDGTWYLLRSRDGFTGMQFGVASDIPVPADYDGDGKTDVAVYRGGNWYLLRSQLGFTGVNFGLQTDRPVVAAFVP